MLDQCDHLVGPCDGVVDGQVVAVLTQKMPHRLKGSALVALLECMCSRNTSQQNDGEHNDVLFAKAKEVSRPRQCAFEQATIAQKVRLARRFDLEPIVIR